MSEPMLVLSPKFKDFLTVDVPREFLEGTTAAGKTTVGITKFMFKVADSDVKFHIIAGADLGTVEKNVINSERGLLDQFNKVASYHGNGKAGTRLPHIRYMTNKGVKIIYICGYDNKKRWQKVLGGQVGCVYIDEVNIADMEFLREITHRCQYMMTTSNPDDPAIPVYKEFINRSRPLKRYAKDYPRELLDELNEPAVKGWVHWYFTFYDNASLTPLQIQAKIDAVPVGTKMYKNKIQGLRGRATGQVFSNFDKNKHVIDWMKAKSMKFVMFSAGVDTSYSAISPDTISFIFQGITNKGELVVLDEEVHNNKNLAQPLAPSDIVPRLFEFVDRNAAEWGMPQAIFIDNADQATITEARKYLITNPRVYSIQDSWKKMKIVDRIHLTLSWLNIGCYLILSHCKVHINEMEIYSWQEDKYEPEDKNDHTINASQYGFLPYKKVIGGKQ